MALRQFTIQTDEDVAQALVSLAEVIRYLARVDDMPLPMTRQARLYGAAQFVKRSLPAGSFADQLIDFIASPTQDDGKPVLTVVRSDRA